MILVRNGTGWTLAELSDNDRLELELLHRNQISVLKARVTSATADGAASFFTETQVKHWKTQLARLEENLKVLVPPE
jgi:hypothetical protein